MVCSAYTAHLLVWALQAQPLWLPAGDKGLSGLWVKRHFGRDPFLGDVAWLHCCKKNIKYQLCACHAETHTQRYDIRDIKFLRRFSRECDSDTCLYRYLLYTRISPSILIIQFLQLSICSSIKKVHQNAERISDLCGSLNPWIGQALLETFSWSLR